MSDKRKRKEQVNVRLTLDELMQIAENALDAGFTTIPSFLRDLGMNAKKDVDQSSFGISV